MAKLREEPDSDEGSSPDEGVPGTSSGHRCEGEPMKVGVGYVQRDFCDGQSLASPGRWAPSSKVWNRVADCYRRFTRHHGTGQLLVSLAMGKIEECPFPPEDVAGLKQELIDIAAGCGFLMQKKEGDRTDVPIDVRFLDLLLGTAGDPEVGLGEYAQGVRVGPCKRMPRLPALQKPKRKWRLASQMDPLDYLEHFPDHGGVWRRNHSTLQAFEEQVLEVMRDQANRGQMIVMTEPEAKERFPNLAIASLGAQRKEKPGGKVITRVLSDGTHGLCVNSRTRLRDQERAPLASNLKRAMREKAKVDEVTFALTADVTEAQTGTFSAAKLYLEAKSL